MPNVTFPEPLDLPPHRRPRTLTPPAALTLARPASFSLHGVLHVSNIALKSNEVLKFAILVMDADGAVMAAPPGDTFTAMSHSPAELEVTIGTMAHGAPAVVLTPLVHAAVNLKFEVHDSLGLKMFEDTVTISTDAPKATAIGLDLMEPESSAHTMPAPGVVHPPTA